MNVSIDTNIDRFYLDVFSILNINFFKLRKKELRVLAAIYSSNYKLIKEIKSVDNRMNILFSADNKEKLAKSLNISYNSFMNSLTILRKEGFITNNVINKNFCFNPDNTNINIVFKCQK